MKTKGILMVIITAGLMIFSSSNSANAQCAQKQQQQVTSSVQPAGMCCMGMQGLTAEQEKQIKDLHQKMMKEMLHLKNQIAEKKAHLQTISTGDNVDMAAVNKTIDELFVLKAEVDKKKIALQQDVRKLLNDEQKIMFDMHKAKGKKCGKGGGCGMKDGMGCQGEGMGTGSAHGSGMGCGMGQTNQGASCGMNQGMGNAGCHMGQEKGKGCCKDKTGAGSNTQGSGCGHMKNN